MFVGKTLLNRARGNKLPAALALYLVLLLALALAVLWQWPEPAITSQPQARQKQVFQQLLQRFWDWQVYLGLKPKPHSARFSPDGKMIVINGCIWSTSPWSDPTQASVT